MKKILKWLGLCLNSEYESVNQGNLELSKSNLHLLNQVAELNRQLEIQAEHHKKIEEIKIAQVNLAISGENDRLKTRLSEVTGELNDLQHRHSVAKLELESAQTDIDLAAENAELKQRLVELAAHHKRTEAGVKTLVTFIHRTHRLNLPFADNTIRGAIQKALNKQTRNGS